MGSRSLQRSTGPFAYRLLCMLCAIYAKDRWKILYNGAGRGRGGRERDGRDGKVEEEEGEVEGNRWEKVAEHDQE